MKVWIVNHYAIPPKYGGLNRHYYFSKYLDDIDIKIITSSNIHNTKIDMIDTKDFIKEIKVDDVLYTYIKTNKYFSGILGRIYSFIEFPIRAYRALKILSKKEKPDIIYTSTPDIFTSYMAVKFAIKRNIPVIVEVRDLWPESIIEFTKLTKFNPIIKILYGIEKWIYKKSDKLIFTFEGAKDYILEKKLDKKGVNLEKIEYINNGVDLSSFKYNLENYILDDSVLESDSFKVIYTGSIRRVNRIDMILNAAIEIRDKGYDIKFIIYGDGNYKELLEKRAKDQNIDNIVFKGRVDKKYIPYILSKSDLNIIVGEETNKIDSYGLSLNKLFDYMASSKPILINIKSGYDNVLKYNCGSVVDGSDIKSLVNEIERFYKMDKEEYDNYCKNSKIAAKDFDYKNLSNKLRKILKETYNENQ